MIKLRIVARGLLRISNKILLCKNIKENFYFLPGGRVKNNEDCKSTLMREFNEELSLEILVKSYLGVIENFWSDKHQKFKEYNFIFEVKTKENVKDKFESNENHISFSTFYPNEIKNLNITLLPYSIKNFIFKQSKKENYFFEKRVK